MDAYRTLKGITIDSPDINTIQFSYCYGLFIFISRNKPRAAVKEEKTTTTTAIPHVKCCSNSGNECTHLVNHYHFYPFNMYIVLLLLVFYRFMGDCVALLLVLHQLFHFKQLVRPYFRLQESPVRNLWDTIFFVRFLFVVSLKRYNVYGI